MWIDTNSVVQSPVRRRPLLALAAALACCSVATGQAFKPKPIRPLGCPAGEKIVLEAGPVENPYVMNVVKTHWMEYLGQVQTATLVGGAGAASGVQPRMEDQTEEFKSAVSAALRGVDLQQLLLSAMERNLSGKTTCQTVFRKAKTVLGGTVPANDRLVAVGISFAYYGGKPGLKAWLGAMEVAKDVNLEQVNMEAAALQKLSDEMRTMPPMKLMRSGKVNELNRAVAQLTSHMDGTQTLSGSSQSHRVEDWTANDGALIRQELEAVLDRLVIQLGGSLFP